MSSRTRYRFGPLERRGLLGPFALPQAGLLLAGALLAVFVLNRSPTPVGTALAMTCLLFSLLLARASFAGRPLHEWTAVVLTAVARRIAHRSGFRSRAPEEGERAARTSSPRRARLPHELGGVAILGHEFRGHPLGMFSENRGRVATAVLACRVNGFTLLDPEAQERRLRSWGSLLTGLAGTAVRRVQWVERTAPASGDELARYLDEERDPGVCAERSTMLESYLDLIANGTRVAQEHEVLVALQVDGARLRTRGGRGIESLLLEQTERLAQGLEAAEIGVLGALTPSQLARALGTAYDPFAGGGQIATRPADPGAAGAGWHAAAPMAVREAWDHLQADGALHTTFWICGWPRTEVTPMFMDTLLGRAGAVRAVAVCFEPLSPERATREVEAAITRDRADRELRARLGQTETARQRQVQDSAMRREHELAAGHGDVRFSGFVTVSGRTPEELRRACGEVLDHAARARIELRRMYGQQAAAFTFTLPICRGLR